MHRNPSLFRAATFAAAACVWPCCSPRARAAARSPGMLGNQPPSPAHNCRRSSTTVPARLTSSTAWLTLRIVNPRLSIPANSHRLRLDFDVGVGALGRTPPSGHMAIASGLRFDAGTHGLHLDQPTLESADFPGLGGAMNATGRELVNRWLDDYARNEPVPPRRQPGRTHRRAAHRLDHDRQWPDRRAPGAMTMKMKRTFLAVAFAFALAGCGHKQQAAQQDADTPPAPEAGNGSVTGMPARPGPARSARPRHPRLRPWPTRTRATRVAARPGAGHRRGRTQPSAPADAAAEPAPGDEVKLVRDYYAAINARDYAGASPAVVGQRRGQPPDPAAVRRRIRRHHRRERGDRHARRRGRGAGQRYIEIPVTVTATHADGSRHRYAGSYVLHRTVVDGASAEQRAWRIDSAKLRETGP